jgi:predicted SnoaL-like aldol condensation-catalyzing enzyme
VIETRRNGRELVIQRDKTVHDGPNDFADYGERHFERNPNGRTEVITKRNDGTYIVKGSPKEWYSTRYRIGFRRDWTDYSQ